MSFDLRSGYCFKCEIKSGNPISATIGLGCYLLNIQISFDTPRLDLPRNLTNLSGVVTTDFGFLGYLAPLER